MTLWAVQPRHPPAAAGDRHVRLHRAAAAGALREFRFVSLPDGTSKGDGLPDPFDVLPFGGQNELRSAKSKAERLAFSNLQIDLRSPLATPNAVTFHFDAGNLVLRQ
jgi:hypothetical protein